MAEISVPKGGGQDNDATAWELMGLNMGGDGVITGLQVSLLTGAGVRLASGRGLSGGFNYENTANLDRSSDANSSSMARIDRWVLRRTWSSLSVAATIIQGTPSPSPVPPQMGQVRSGGVWDVPLARWTVPANGALPLTGLVDERAYVTPGLGFRVNSGIFAGQPNTATSTCGIVHGLGNDARITVTPIDIGSPADRLVRFVQVGQDATTAQYLCQRLDTPDLSRAVYVLGAYVADRLDSDAAGSDPLNDTLFKDATVARLRAELQVAAAPTPFHDNVVAFHWVAVVMG